MKRKVKKEQIKKESIKKEQVKKEPIKKEQLVNRFYAGIILFKDGWHKMYSDGNNHYTYEKMEEE